MIKTIFYVVYFALLAAGAGWLATRNPGAPAVFIATRDLPIHHVLQAGDAIPVAPLYTTQVIRKGDPVGAGNTSAASRPAPEGRQLSVTVAVDRSLVSSSAINAGSPIRVCQSGKPVLEGSKALEVVCPAGAGACVAIAEVALDKVSGVAKALENKAPLTAHPAGSACS
jgi:hypothetical protein